MPRMSDAEKKKSHQRIVSSAARMVREKGIDAISVSEVMQAAGLTHGGFYRHFKSKEDLVAAAVHHAVDDVLSDFEAAAGDRPDAARTGYIDRYLSVDHAVNTGKGCPLAALGGELARLAGGPAEQGNEAVQRTHDLLGGKDDPEQAYAVMGLLIGTVTLARLRPEAREPILKAGRVALEGLLRDEAWRETS